jgi:diadenosine tetraphosphate (Ap4A) HIT family hydrolase
MTSSCSLCDRFADPDYPLTVFRTQKIALTHMHGIDLPGYLVIAPVRHVEHAGILEDSEREELARLQSLAVQTILGLPGVRKVYILSFGEAVPHLHIHLFPRTDAMLSAPECLTEGIPDGPKLFDFWRIKLAVPDVPVAVSSLIPQLKEVFLKFSSRIPGFQEP